MQEIYVIFSPGRTGSHIILEALTGSITTPGGLCNAVPFWYPRNKNKSISSSINTVIHTHSLQVISDLKLDTTNIVLIVSQRRDIFAQTMSLLVANITDEWNGKDYSNKPLAPKEISKHEFTKTVSMLQSWAPPTNSHYKKIISLYYEDIINIGLPHIASALDIEYNEKIVGTVHKKSPYNYKNWILNWEELYQEFLLVDNRSNK